MLRSFIYFINSERIRKTKFRFVNLSVIMASIILNLLTGTKAYSVAYTWTGAGDNTWNNNANWAPAGFPTAADNAAIGVAAVQPVLNSAVSVVNLTINSGCSLNLNQYLISVAGTFTLNTGGNIDINNDTLWLLGTSNFNGGTITNSGSAGLILVQGTTTTFGNVAGGPTISADINVTSATLTIRNTTFNNLTTLEKTAGANDVSVGNNLFNGTTTITNSSSTGYILLSNTTFDIFNGDVTFKNTQSNILYVAHNNAGTQFNGNIVIYNTGTGSIRYCQGTGTATLANGKTISVGGWGAAGGALYLKNFTQTGATSQTINVNAGTGILYLQTGVTFNADVNISFPRLMLNGSTFNGITTLEKNGASNDAGTGGNTFNQPVNIINSGTGYLMTANTTKDIFNADLTVTNTGTNLIHLAYNDATGSQFNGNIIVNSTSGTGIRFCTIAGTAILAATKTISVGATGFTTGTLLLRNFTQTGATPQNITLTGTAGITLGPATAFDGDITTSSPALLLNGGTFNGLATFVKTGATNDAGTGGNIFNQDLYATVTGAGYLQFNGAGNDSYNGNIILESTGGGFRFGQNAGTCTLDVNKTINIGVGGFTTGSLRLRNFTQSGATAQVMTLSGTAALYLEAGSVFNADVNFIAPQLYLNGTTYNGITYLEKNGATNNVCTGGNVFNQVTTLVNSGSAYIRCSNVTKDIFNSDVTLSNTGSSLIDLAFNDATGSQFNGNILVNSTNGIGIQFGSGIGTAVLANTKTITVGAGGFTAGTLLLRNFTQTGPTAQTLALTAAAGITFGPASTFEGDVTSTSSALLLNGCTFNGIASFVKNGASNDQCTGNNIFNGITTLTNNGIGYLQLARTTRDIFNTDVEFINNNSSLIYVAYNDATGTQLNGNVLVNSTAGTGIQFGSLAGTATLANGKTISVGASGFSVGTLLLRNFTQSGSTAQTLTLTGSAGLTMGPASGFGGDLITSSSALLLNGSTFSGNTDFTKFGATNDQSAGNNIFNGSTASITNNGSGYIILSFATKDIFNSDVTFTNTNANIIYPAYNAVAGTQFNGNIILNNTGAGGIRFGQSSGLATLANGKTISIGPLGFPNGSLYFRNFTQLGNTAQTLSIAAVTTALYLQTGSVFNGSVNFNFPQIYLNGSTFNDTTVIEKNGATNNSCTGANTFNGNTTIKNSGSGFLRLAITTADNFNNSVTFIKTGAGNLSPAYTGTNNFTGDISTLGTASSISFGTGGGNATLTGSAMQNIDGSLAFPPIFLRLAMSNGINGMTLRVPVTITTTLTLTTGNIFTTSTNLLNIANGATVSGANDASYVDGPVRKTGNQAFTFPTGENGYYHSIGITAPALVTDHFTADYTFIDPNSLYDVTSHDPTIDHISRCEYWTLNRTNGASNVTVTLGWNAASCGITVLADLSVCRWDVPLTMWKDHGNASTTGNNSLGTVTSSVVASSFGIFTLGSTTSNNPLPIELVDFNADLVGKDVIITWQTQSEINNDFFTIERSGDGVLFESIATLHGAGNSNIIHHYLVTDHSPLNELSYYRLRQTDYDGVTRVFDPERVYNNVNEIVSVSPNPFNNNIIINVQPFVTTDYKVELSDINGKTIFSNTSTFSKDEPIADLNVSSILPGVYILRIIGNDKVFETRKMVKF